MNFFWSSLLRNSTEGSLGSEFLSYRMYMIESNTDITENKAIYNLLFVSIIIKYKFITNRISFFWRIYRPYSRTRIHFGTPQKAWTWIFVTKGRILVRFPAGPLWCLFISPLYLLCLVPWKCICGVWRIKSLFDCGMLLQSYLWTLVDCRTKRQVLVRPSSLRRYWSF